MKAILEGIQDKLKSKFKYVDENWGQLNFERPPVLWPCVLIDCNNADYSDLGNDRTQTPTLRQEGIINVELTVGNLKLTNSSANAPKTQQDKAFEIYDHIKDLHKILQGAIIGNGKLIRKKHQRVRRIDGIQEHRLIYTIVSHNC